MVARRLAEDSVQPAEFAFNNDNAKWAEGRIGLYPAGRQQSAVIPLLMRVQEQEGWISRAAIEKVATMLDMPYIRVLEVATFYTQFQLQPVGTRAHIQVCGTTPCMLRGAEDLRAVCQKKIHPEAHHTNADGTLSWEEVECLGACVNAPMVAIFQDTYEDLTPQRLEEIIDAFAAGKGETVKPGSQLADRFNSAAEGGRTTLIEEPSAKREKFVPPPAPDALETAVTPAAQPTAAPAPAPTKEAVAKAKPTKAKSIGLASETVAPLFTAPEGAKDDLKLISGVGPVLEGKLNALGISQFAQIAKFKKADITRVDDVLNFKGRIERDEWVKQAKALAKGGVEEYRKVFGKDPR